MSWQVDVEVMGEEGSWTTNGLRFATQAEAERYGCNLHMRWTLVTQHRTTESLDSVNVEANEAGDLRRIEDKR